MLWALQNTKQLTAEELPKLIQRDLMPAKRTLESMVEIGLVQARGNMPPPEASRQKFTAA